MQRSISNTPMPGRHLVLRPLRLLAATASLALLMQAAVAMPPGGHGSHGGMPAVGDVGGMMMAHPRQMTRVFDTIGATAEQRAQIKQIADALRADLRAQREAGRQMREQAQAIFAQPAIDEAAAEGLRKQMLARHDQSSQRVMQAMLDMSRVLTAEQRKTLVDRMAQQRALMERHRAEREAIGQPTR